MTKLPALQDSIDSGEYSPSTDSFSSSKNEVNGKKRVRQISKSDLDAVLSKGLSQKEASKSLGVSISTIQRRFRENYPQKQWKEMAAISSQASSIQKQKSNVQQQGNRLSLAPQQFVSAALHPIMAQLPIGEFHHDLLSGGSLLGGSALRLSATQSSTSPFHQQANVAQTPHFSEPQVGLLPSRIAHDMNASSQRFQRLYPATLSDKLQCIVEECEMIHTWNWGDATPQTSHTMPDVGTKMPPCAGGVNRRGDHCSSTAFPQETLSSSLQCFSNQCLHSPSNSMTSYDHSSSASNFPFQFMPQNIYSSHLSNTPNNSLSMTNNVFGQVFTNLDIHAAQLLQQQMHMLNNFPSSMGAPINPDVSVPPANRGHTFANITIGSLQDGNQNEG